MKSLLAGILLTLGFATSAMAQNLAVVNSQSSTINEISPFDLVTNSYQGYLEDRGIPSASLFLTGVRTNDIKAEDLIRGAIAKGRLAEDKINDEDYINNVDSLMQNLDRN